MFLFVMEVSAHAQELIPTPVAITLSQYESLEINDFSFESVCNNDVDNSFDDCMNQIASCQDFDFDGTCISEFCNDFSFESQIDFDECMREACRDFSFESAGPNETCPIDDSCGNEGSVSCEIEICSNTGVNGCFDGFNTVCNSELLGFSFENCVTAICNSLRNPASCPFQDCISQGLDASECETLVCGAGYDLPFCVSTGQQNENVPLAVETSGIQATSHGAMVMIGTLLFLLSMTSVATYRK